MRSSARHLGRSWDDLSELWGQITHRWILHTCFLIPSALWPQPAWSALLEQGVRTLSGDTHIGELGSQAAAGPRTWAAVCRWGWRLRPWLAGFRDRVTQMTAAGHPVSEVQMSSALCPLFQDPGKSAKPPLYFCCSQSERGTAGARVPTLLAVPSPGTPIPGSAASALCLIDPDDVKLARFPEQQEQQTFT